jgi:hypothetical protein
MLGSATVRHFQTVVAALLLAASGMLPLGGTAYAQPDAAPVSCPPGESAIQVSGELVCWLREGGLVRADGEPLRLTLGSGGRNRQATTCVRPYGDDTRTGPAGPKTVPCYIPVLGWYSHSWDCHFASPRRSDRADESTPGYDPDDRDGGRLYRASCYPPAANEYELGPHWIYDDPPLWAEASLVALPSPPDGYNGTPSSLGELWVEAINRLQLRGPAIATAPPLHTAGIVRLPTWVWTERDEHVWGEVTATADARPEGPNEWVTARAEAARIEWDMGDGGEPVVCEHPGVPWEPGMEDRQGHGECSYRYLSPSRDEDGGTFTITAVTTWRVEWWVNGVWDGELELRVGSAADFKVTEIQVLVGYR